MISALRVKGNVRISREEGVRARPLPPTCSRDNVIKSPPPFLLDIEMAVFPSGQEEPAPRHLLRWFSS